MSLLLLFCLVLLACLPVLTPFSVNRWENALHRFINNNRNLEKGSVECLTILTSCFYNNVVVTHMLKTF